VNLIVEDINISGVYNLVPNETITKYELLKNIAKVFNKEIKIVRDSTITSNKVLKNTRVNEYNPLIPSYDNQLRELKRFIELNK
jgi:dTDP-4-dehydrorhamnose reductase